MISGIVIGIIEYCVKNVLNVRLLRLKKSRTYAIIERNIGKDICVCKKNQS